MLPKRQEAITRMEQSGRNYKRYKAEAEAEVTKVINAAKAPPVIIDLAFAKIATDDATKAILREEIIKELKEGGWRVTGVPVADANNPAVVVYQYEIQ